MKKILCFLIAVFTIGNTTGLFAQSTKQSTVKTYKNPLPVVLGDPYVLHVKDDQYYLYGTGGATNGFAAYSSADLVHRKSEGQVWFAGNKNGWSDSTAGWGGAYWAPEVYQVKDKFYMFYSAQ
ncbi:MAG TPA: family 43 glycosylhydrolase [Parafilimonas sp.]|nr:family 43 glycosylhydrolase [Parafilimonas sp.]